MFQQHVAGIQKCYNNVCEVKFVKNDKYLLVFNDDKLLATCCCLVKCLSFLINCVVVRAKILATCWLYSENAMKTYIKLFL